LSERAGVLELRENGLRPFKVLVRVAVAPELAEQHGEVVAVRGAVSFVEGVMVHCVLVSVFLCKARPVGFAQRPA
jgi:hypothetical protein